MKKVQIRQCVFETNSSSTHSVTIIPEEQYKKFLKGELYVDVCGNLSEKEEDEYGYKEFYSINDDDCPKIETAEITASNGEKFVALSLYKND